MNKEIDKYMIATVALHKMGDISRPVGDICRVTTERENDYLGAWVTGYGFIGVKFPKDSTRELTKEEVKEYNQRSFQIGGQSVWKLGIDVS
jgi:hypothetical protein